VRENRSKDAARDRQESSQIELELCKSMHQMGRTLDAWQRKSNLRGVLFGDALAGLTSNVVFLNYHIKNSITKLLRPKIKT
jgi:hypothetical protein